MDRKHRRRPGARAQGRARSLTVTTSTLAAMGIVLASCGSGQGAGGNGSATTSGAKSSSTSFTVGTSKLSGVGTVLVDHAGRTLYAFAPDKQQKPTCTGTCASVWPPLTTSANPVAGPGTSRSLLGTVKDGNGKMQVTYDHWPLYTYVGDQTGKANGQGLLSFGGKWWTIDAQGHLVGSAASSSSSTTSTTSSYGY